MRNQGYERLTGGIIKDAWGREHHDSQNNFVLEEVTSIGRKLATFGSRVHCPVQLHLSAKG